MQLKSAISKIAKEKHIPAQLVMQNYMLERLLERISRSKYQGNFILKGGRLIASMVGLHSRATMDMDATIRNHPVNENSIKTMFEEIVSIPIDDDISFSFQGVGEIRKNDAYGGYRISLTILRKALSETAKKRHSDDLIPQYRSIVEQVVKSTAMLQHWKT